MNIKWVVGLIALIVTASAVSQQTYVVEDDLDIRALSESQDRYLLAVANMKQWVQQGRPKELETAITQFKQDFPQADTEQMEEFFQAERLYANGKLRHAFDKYEEFLDAYPKTRLYDAVLSRQFDIAGEYLRGRKYNVLAFIPVKGYSEGERMMEKIIDRAGDAPIAQKAAIQVAKMFEKRKKYDQAYDQWSMIYTRWPTGETGKTALLKMAQTKHTLYNGPKFTDAPLISAKSYYREYAEKYPQEAKELGIESTLEEIEQQLAYKQYAVGCYYKRTGSLQAAALYFQMILDQWPDSVAAELAKEKMQNMVPMRIE